MVDNENKNLNEQDNKEEKVSKNPFGNVLIILICYFIAMFFLNNIFGVGEKEKKPLSVIESITLNSFTEEEEIRCVGITAVYEVDGTKNYQVRFSVPNYSMYFDGIVPASLVEVDKVIDKDSKYKANITYTYSNEVFDKLKSRTVFTKKYNSDAEYLEVMENSEDIIRITNVECMFSDYLTLQTEDEVKKEFEDLYVVDDENV
jgi:hypothetical protein